MTQEITPQIQIDHINGNRTDNSLTNLRLATGSQNCMNKAAVPKTSAYRGVHRRHNRPYWVAQIKENGRNRTIGKFASEEEAARAYDGAARSLHGDFARLNLLTYERNTQ